MRRALRRHAGPARAIPKHWAFNEHVKREGAYRDAPPTHAKYHKLGTRVVDLDPDTLAQNARTSGGGNNALFPTRALTVGPVETWQAGPASLHLAGRRARSPFGQRITTLMIS